ncbi:hypothetical protein [Pseudomonas sp. dw_358]|uniref:hypothetical protein n=1 Tax=Pseudomonas sp. dw_358 TaxID=2720083 RepID=UPI001BD6CFA2|nr:hypothetical protein [Pseudomonas sp. dw_358]
MKDISDLKLRPRSLTNIFTAVRPGRYMLAAALTAVTTFSGITTLQAGDYYSFQIMIPNLGPAFTAQISYSVCSAAGSDSVVAVTPAGGAWATGQAVAVSAGGTSAGLNSEIVVWSLSTVLVKKSLVRTDSPTQARSLVAWRVQMPSGVQPTVPNLGSYYWAQDNQSWPMMKSASQAVAGVDTPANFTTTAVTAEGGATNPFYVGIKYTSTKWGKQFLICGDSIMEGLGGNARFFGGVQRAACNLSTPDNPIEWFNSAQHAQTPYVYAANMAQSIALVNPTSVWYAPYTINNITKSATSPGLTAAIKEEDYWGLATLSRVCAALPRQPSIFISEPLPNAIYDSSSGTGATTAANDSLRQAFITELASFGNDPTPALVTSTGLTAVSIMRQGFTVVKGLSASWADPTLVNGQQVPKADALGTDRTHPLELGYTRDIEPVYRPYAEAA